MLDQLTRMLRSTTADKSGRSISSAIFGLGSFDICSPASRTFDAARRCHTRAARYRLSRYGKPAADGTR